MQNFVPISNFTLGPDMLLVLMLVAFASSQCEKWTLNML